MESRNLRKLRSPHNWGFDSYKDIEEHLLRKLTNCDNDNYDVDTSDTKYAYQVNGYLLHCLLSYEKYRNGKYTEALEHIDKTNVTDAFMDKYGKVFKHISKASRAQILYKMNSLKEMNQIVNELEVDTFNKIEEAGFKYVESRLRIKYVEPGISVTCIELIESAIETVKDEAEFYFSLGLILGRVRHYNFPAPPPTSKEFDASRKAVSLKKDMPSYSISLARLYMDIRYNLPKEKRIEHASYAASIYRNLLKYHASLSGNDIARCVFNLMKVKFDPNLEEYADLALKKSDTVLVNHYIGMFYIRNNQTSEALDCLNKVVQDLPYICNVVLLLMYRVNGNSLSDIESELLVKQWTHHYKTSTGMKVLLRFHLAISQFYLLVKSDFTKASIHFLLAYEHDILEAYHVNITKHHNASNFLAILKNELLSQPMKNEKMMEALIAISKLPRHIVTQKNSRWPVPTLFELKRDLW